MTWAGSFLYILKGNNFQDLATCDHEMEITLKGHGKGRASSSKTIVEKEFKQFDKVSKLQRSYDCKPEQHSSDKFMQSRSMTRRRIQQRKISNVKGRRWRNYELKNLFLVSDWSSMINVLLENKIIQPLDPKRPDEVNKVDDPTYCRCHRLVSHLIEDCGSLNELIMKFARECQIVPDTEEGMSCNNLPLDHPNANFRSFISQSHERYEHKIQFVSL